MDFLLNQFLVQLIQVKTNKLAPKIKIRGRVNKIIEKKKYFAISLCLVMVLI